MKKIIITAIILVVIALVAGYFIFDFSGDGKVQYRTAEITRGNIESTIASTGTLSPVTTVEVGTQVSGTIAEVYVDYNDVVKKGQLLAVVDTVMLKAAVLDAQAGLEKAEAQLELAQSDYNRNKTLFDNKLISESDFLTYSVNLKSQKAALQSAKATLQRAKQNLEYAYIYSPINGTVIEKNVEAGQTVAASLSTPTLFIIAQNLSRMEILASVDESDIGQIKDSMPVRFTVQAYPDKTFEGEVTQIRLQPTTVSNVVTYTVVINSENKESLLLPGMTATVTFIIAHQNDVLLVPNAALRFQPSEEVMAAYFKKSSEARQAGMLPTGHPGNRPDSIHAFADTTSERAGINSRQTGQNNIKRIWVIDDKGNITMERVKTGITDGSKTEITGRNLDAGLKVIVGTQSGTTEAESSNRRINRPFGRPPRF